MSTREDSHDWEIWHNPRCSKSRQTLALLQEHDIEPEVREYLTDPPSAEEIEAVLAALDRAPREVVRVADARRAGVELPAPDSERRHWIELMAAHPALIERPIVLAPDGRAALGRPPEDVLALLGD
jgi:arsenate reductase